MLISYHLTICNDDREKGEGFEGCYLSSILIKKLDNILMEQPFKNNVYYNPEKVSGYEISLESGLINGRIICLEAVIDIVDKYKNILIEE
ncbi:hypothetical protein [Snodgrassella communis]|jgi:hypothetical protein|nr:hypothetical protein [Snodgrassella communis]PIT09040.1 hypothetical protein BGI31_04315 [Snodgrassella communis]